MINHDERESCADGLKGPIKMISGYELLNNPFKPGHRLYN